MSTTRPASRNKFEVYAIPLPLQIYPLPAFIPHNPLSLLRIAYALLSEILYPSRVITHATSSSLLPFKHSRIQQTYTAVFDSYTNTIQVTDSIATQALWERGFFGKGSLSRSEPEWVARVVEARRKREEDRVAGKRKGKTAAEVTEERRRERKEAKRERARKEVEELEDLLKRERDSTVVEVGQVLTDIVEHVRTEEVQEGKDEDLGSKEAADSIVDGVEHTEVAIPQLENLRPLDPPEIHIPSDPIPLENQEHLQLAPQEAFFLAYGLGIISVLDSTSRQTLSIPDLLERLCASSTFPPKKLSNPAQDPANDFLISYAVYHHFRSLGWVVRPGIKFSVDFLLYARGPVFAHAQFAVMILPSFGHPYWSETEDRQKQKERAEKKDWWYFHCVNRVQSQVLKSLVLCYVEVPPRRVSEDLDVGSLLRRYKVREFVMRRWAPQRNLK